MAAKYTYTKGERYTIQGLLLVASIIAGLLIIFGVASLLSNIINMNIENLLIASLIILPTLVYGFFIFKIFVWLKKGIASFPELLWLTLLIAIGIPLLVFLSCTGLLMYTFSHVRMR